ncbi:MAG: hypothetical protein ACYTG0_11570 [Planctomycetota bacterium]|jgi:hypothetical protein
MGEKEEAFGENEPQSSYSADGCLLTEGGNFIGCYDSGFQCGHFRPGRSNNKDDYAWTKCNARGEAGEDEVLIIESGNPTWCGEDPDDINDPDGNSYNLKKTGDTDYYGPQEPGADNQLAEVAGDSSKAAPTPCDGWEDPLKLKRGTWGTDLSPYQKAHADKVKYKRQVVRRELVHGSYEQHIEGDKHITIEGTEFITLKGNLWHTFYGYVHHDYNEHFEEVYHGTKTEVQQKDIHEYNYGHSNEHYYKDVTNEFGKEGEPINVHETYYGHVVHTYHSGLLSIPCMETHIGHKLENYFGTKTEFILGGKGELLLGLLLSFAFGGGVKIEEPFFLELGQHKIKKRLNKIESNIVSLEDDTLLLLKAHVAFHL